MNDRKARGGSAEPHEEVRGGEADGQQEDGQGHPPSVPPRECDTASGAILDDAAADDGVAFVENSGLPAGDPIDGGVELEREPARSAVTWAPTGSER